MTFDPHAYITEIAKDPLAKPPKIKIREFHLLQDHAMKCEECEDTINTILNKYPPKPKPLFSEN